ncbi:MAG TPA: hypothetical protein VE343_14350 [Streptosporangiaceae bacterium]|nr:hypothetical protein [Streptosporangiaceae bacterium]
MTEPARCAYCGSPAPPASAPDSENPLRSLRAELRRIREIAEARQVSQTVQGAEQHLAEQRIADLTREVAELRATVGRLRGSAAPGLAWSR